MKGSSVSLENRVARSQDRADNVYGEGPSSSLATNKRKRVRVKREKKPRAEMTEQSQTAVGHTPWLRYMPSRQYTNPEQRLHDEILAYTTYMQPTSQELLARQLVFSRIRQVIQARFPRGEIVMFGSSITGLCHPRGDIDITISINPPLTHDEMKRPLFQLSSMLKSAGLTTDVMVNHRARVPILSFHTLPRYGSYSVDIGIGNTEGVPGAALVRTYLEQMPALRPLIMVLKGFMAQKELNNPSKSGLGSYALTCMCINFLQLNPSNRPLDFIQKPMENESLGVLLKDFMLHYGVSFPYDTSYVSNTGTMLPKSSAKWITNKVRGALVVQCLLNPENDVAKSAGRIAAIRDELKQCSSNLLQLSIADTNILGDMVGVDDATIEYREHITHIVDSGALNAALFPNTLPARPSHSYRPLINRIGGSGEAPPSNAPPRQSRNPYRPPTTANLPRNPMSGGVALGISSASVPPSVPPKRTQRKHPNQVLGLGGLDSALSSR